MRTRKKKTKRKSRRKLTPLQMKNKKNTIEIPQMLREKYRSPLMGKKKYKKRKWRYRGTAIMSFLFHFFYSPLSLIRSRFFSALFSLFFTYDSGKKTLAGFNFLSTYRITSLRFRSCSYALWHHFTNLNS